MSTKADVIHNYTSPIHCCFVTVLSQTYEWHTQWPPVCSGSFCTAAQEHIVKARERPMSLRRFTPESAWVLVSKWGHPQTSLASAEGRDRWWLVSPFGTPVLLLGIVTTSHVRVVMTCQGGPKSNQGLRTTNGEPQVYLLPRKLRLALLSAGPHLTKSPRG